MRLTDLPDRVLDFLASMVCGSDARVLVTPRSSRPLSAALGSLTLVLHPDRAGFYDLFLGGRLLRNRHEFEQLRKGGGSPGTHTKRRWVQSARASLEDDYPRIHSLDGFHHPQYEGRPHPQLSWDKLPLDPLDPNRLSGPGHIDAAPGIFAEGAGDDFKHLLEALSAGNYPTERLPEFPDVPVATINYELKFSQAFPLTIEQEERLLSAHMRTLARQSALTCFIEKAESMVDFKSLPARKLHGVRLDTNLLVHAVVAARAGHNVRLFRERNENFEPFFDGRQHVVFCALAGADRQNLPMLAAFYQALDVDLVILAFADRLVTLPDGRKAYVHIPVMVKDIDDTFEDGYLWKRMLHLRDHSVDLPGRHVSFQPLQLRTIIAAIDRVLSRGHHRFCWFNYIAPDLLTDVLPLQDEEEFLARTASRLESQVEELYRRFEGEVSMRDFLVNVPAALQSRGRRGGVLAELGTLAMGTRK